MKSSFGKNLKITIWGGSHENEIGVSIENLPYNINIDMEELQSFMDRRAPGNSPYSTPRKEPDIPIKTSDNPLSFIIKNQNTRPKDYTSIRDIPRPGHADYPAWLKYKDSINMSGGGPFSGRMTAPLCIAGGIALQILKKENIEVKAYLDSAGGKIKKAAYEAILEAKELQDSVGGVVKAKILNFPQGIGDAMYGGLESFLSPIIFGIPGVKGLSFGAGFNSARMRGSQNNDGYRVENNQVKIVSNNAGGVLGGISTGMPITLSVAFKPTPSIGKPQESVNLKTMTNETLSIEGRHDPCIAFRAVPALEAALAIGLLDAMIESGYKFKLD